MIFNRIIHRVFWLCFLIAVMTNQADAGIIIWQPQRLPQGSESIAGLRTIAAGEMRSQAIDLQQAATLEQLYLGVAEPWWYSTTGGTAQISVWFGKQAGQKETLLYNGGVKQNYTGLSTPMQSGRTWLTVENLAGSQTITWASFFETSGGMYIAPSGMTQTEGYNTVLTGTPVPEPGLFPALIIASLFFTALFFPIKFRNSDENNKSVQGAGIGSGQWSGQ